MGRRPNPIIAEYFQRGDKLTDNSNRYSHTCKKCGEVFPKGRIDSLTTHITKRCSNTSDKERLSILMRLTGLLTKTSLAAQVRHQQQQQQGQPQAQQSHQQQLPFPPLGFPMSNAQQHWTRLNTLAEVSNQELRNTSLNEHGEDDGQAQDPVTSVEPMSGILHTDQAAGNIDSGCYQMEEAFMLSSPPALSHKDSEDQAHQGQYASQDASGLDAQFLFSLYVANLTPQAGGVKTDRQGSAEDRPKTPAGEDSAGDNHISNVAVAAAATARLDSTTSIHHSNSDNNLGERLAEAIDSVGTVLEPLAAPDQAPETSETISNISAHGEHGVSRPASPVSTSAISTPDTHQLAVPTTEKPPSAPSISAEPQAEAALSQGTQLPWGEITYMSSSTLAQATVDMQPMMGVPTQSVFRFNQDGSKGEHSRQRFSENRRQEVKALRKLGACVRCKTLRKTCSQGDPCDTCRKILSPRHWRIGCFRVKKTAKLNTFNSRISATMLESLIKDKYAEMNLKYPVLVLEASLAGTDKKFALEALQGIKLGEIMDPTELDEHRSVQMQVVMVDPRDVVDERLPVYAADVMRSLVHKTQGSFFRITLESALSILDAAETTLDPPHDIKNLKLALDLWTYIEIMDNEQDWSFDVRPDAEATRFLKNMKMTSTTNAEHHRTLALRLTAEAEKQTEMLSQKLLDHMLRDLQDAKVKIGPAMFFAILVFLVSVEKTAWTLMSWEHVLGDGWPLKKRASDYAEPGQADTIADLLRMLLVIRRALPKLEADDEDILRVSSTSPYHSYFEQLGLKASYVSKQRYGSTFDDTDPQSFSLRFCSNLILPDELLSHLQGDEASQDDAAQTSASQPLQTASATHQGGYLAPPTMDPSVIPPAPVHLS